MQVVGRIDMVRVDIEHAMAHGDVSGEIGGATAKDETTGNAHRAPLGCETSHHKSQKKR